MRKRRSFTDEFKKQCIEDMRTTPASKVIKEHNLTPGLVYRWRKELAVDKAQESCSNKNYQKLRLAYEILLEVCPAEYKALFKKLGI